MGREGVEATSPETEQIVTVALPIRRCLGKSHYAPSQSPLFLTFLTFIHNYSCECPDNISSKIAYSCDVGQGM